MFYIFYVYTEISVWSWKFVLKSWKSPGNPLVKMCKNPVTHVPLFFERKEVHSENAVTINELFIYQTEDELD